MWFMQHKSSMKTDNLMEVPGLWDELCCFLYPWHAACMDCSSKEQCVHFAHICLYARMLSCGKIENLASGFQCFLGVCDRISKDILKDKNGFQNYMSLEHNILPFVLSYPWREMLAKSQSSLISAWQNLSYEMLISLTMLLLIKCALHSPGQVTC